MEHSRCSICVIVKLKRIAKLWLRLAKANDKKLPLDVPRRHLAVIVGEAGKRSIIRVDYLNHPIFTQLLNQAYEEYDYNKKGLLSLPCDEFHFQDIIHFLEGGKKVNFFQCQVAEEKLGSRLWKDSTPLLQGVARGSTCLNRSSSLVCFPIIGTVELHPFIPPDPSLNLIF